MRLTLRTLLAYMDDILDPADQQNLAAQVNESERATEIIHRTRDATRRLRLGAPPVMGEGMELDPNWAAEYLDSTLTPDDMSEYQQVCLDSDVHLAEVASCHHILTMVLGEPAEIDPDMRQRMYTVPERTEEWRQLRLDTGHTAAPAAEVAVPPRASDSGQDEPITGVPDYLKASDEAKFGRRALAFAAIVVLGFGAFILFGPGGILNQDADEVAQNDNAEQAEQAAEQPDGAQGAMVEQDELPEFQPFVAEGEGEADLPPVADGNATVPAEPSPPAVGDTASEPPLENDRELGADNVEVDGAAGAAPFDGGSNPANAQVPPLPSLDEPTTGTDSAGSGNSAAAGNGDMVRATPDLEEDAAAGDNLANSTGQPGSTIGLPGSQAGSNVGLPEGQGGSNVGLPEGGQAGSDIGLPPADDVTPEQPASSTASGDAPEVQGGGTQVAMNSTGGSAASADIPGVIGAGEDQLDDPEAGMDMGEDAEAPEDAPLGTMVSTGQVLLEWQADEGQWMRLPPRSSIAAGDQLMSLPTYRPALALVSGLRVELCDGATLRLQYAEDGTTPQLVIDYGRFLLQNTGVNVGEVELIVNGESKRVQLESTAILGLDVDRPFVSGADVESSLGKFEAKFYAPSGRVTWDLANASAPIDNAAQWTWANASPASITDDVSWLDGQSLDYLAQNVSRYFEKEFDTTQPARVELLELYEGSRRREDKALAALCGTHVGQFVPFVQALADTQQQSNWDEHIEELRRAMSRSTQAAKQIHQTLIEQRGAAVADDLFEMLRGYSPAEIGTTPDEVRGGETRQLIDWLEHDRLEYRVLAIHNLKQIYGGKTLGYNPVVTDGSRQERTVRQWRNRLTDNELVPVYAQQ